MNKETEDKLSKVLHNAIEKALNDTDEEKLLNESIKKVQNDIAKKNGFYIVDPKKDIKPITFMNMDEFYGDDYYEFCTPIKPTPYKKGEFYVRYTNEYLNESVQNYHKPQKLEKIIDSLRCIGLSKDNFDVPNIIDSNGIYGYICVILESDDLQKGHLEMIQKTMEVLGYFQAKKKPKYYIGHPIYGNIMVFQFEPYYFGKRKLTINDQLLHVSPIWNKESILRNGFIASCKNKKFQYPARNYFFTRFIKGSVYSLFYDGGIFQKNTTGTNEYVKFYMDSNKLMEDEIEFYSDPMFIGECAVYTYESCITPSYIKKVEHDLI